MLSTDKLPMGGLPRNSVVRITDRPDVTSAVYRGHKATNQTNKQMYYLYIKIKGADQLHRNRAADLRFRFRTCKSRLSHDTAHI